MTLYVYIASGQGQTSPGDSILMSTKKALLLFPFVASFKEISLKSDFIHFFFFFFFFHDLIHVYSSPGAGDKVLMST